MNGFGFGSATASVWCYPNAPPAAPNYTATDSGLVPTVSFGPGLPGCDPNTSVFVSAGSLWSANTQAIAFGGDTVAWDHSLTLVTPTSPSAATFLSVAATILDPFTVEFHIDWSGTDAGTAQHLQWFDIIDGPPVLIGSEVRVGPWAEVDFIKTIIFPSGGLGSGGEEFLVMASDGVATSLSAVPEPSTCVLAALGLAGLGVFALRKKYRLA